MFWLTPITRSPAQKPAHKDLGRNDQRPVITPKATYVLAHAHNALPGAEVACRTSVAMAKVRPLRLRPLTLRLLSAPVRAH